MPRPSLPPRQVLARLAVVVGVEAVRVPTRVVAVEEPLRLPLRPEVGAVAVAVGRRTIRERLATDGVVPVSSDAAVRPAASVAPNLRASLHEQPIVVRAAVE